MSTGPRRSAVDLALLPLRALASLRLTVALFVLGILLVFLGTLAQKTNGLWVVVDKYFWSYFVLVDLQPTLEFGKIFFGLPKDAKAPEWAKLPFPGGKLIGGLMFFNLLAAHAVRFQLSWRKIGVWVAHAGLMLLFVGEFITREFQVEQRMTIREGEAVNYAEDTRHFELAVTSEAGDGRVTVVPQKRLARAAKSHERIDLPDTPFTLGVEQFMANSEMLTRKEVADRRAGGKDVPDNRATAGLGVEYQALEKPEVSGVETTEAIDMPSAYVTLYRRGSGEAVGTFVVSAWFTPDPFNKEKRDRQEATADGGRYDLDLRPIRYYKPFSLYLDKFRFDRYVGTENAKNYSSDLRLVDPRTGVERDVRIAMNEPLRYGGETFYQADFDKRTEKATVLQVVRNPGWVLPYVACTMVGAGLLFHFGLYLIRFLIRTRTGRDPKVVVVPGGITGFLAYIWWETVRTSRPAATRRTWPEVLIPIGLAAFAVLFLVGQMAPRPTAAKPDPRKAARLPAVDGGRVKPLDTVARVYLRKLSGREEVQYKGDTYPAMKWLLDVLSSNDPEDNPAWDYDVILIENDQVLSLLGLKRQEGRRYSLRQVFPKAGELRKALELADQPADKSAGEARDPADDRIRKLFESGDRDVFKAKLRETAERVELYLRLLEREKPLLLPPADLPNPHRDALGAAIGGGVGHLAPAAADWRAFGPVNGRATREAKNAVFAARAGDLTQEAVERMSSRERAALEVTLKNDVEVARVKALADDDPAAAKLDAVFVAYRAGDQEKFDKAVADYQDLTADGVPEADRRRVRFETFLNEFAPAYQVIKLYGTALVLCLVGWALLLFQPRYADAVRRGTFWLLLVTFVVHTFALVSRMYLTDRPLVFVTNLYSSAVFIGWAAAGVCLLIERLFPVGLGNLVASVVGGGTAIIAHNLAAGGDTLEMMQAVLDTNFWLATHVTTVTLGYSATYVAGLLGLLYVVLGVFTPLLRKTVPGAAAGGKAPEFGRVLGQMVYGIVCLATLLSFVGTVLGGIWADQSWGRFWGWDPKENGAILIVLWNALILHARWAGLVKDRGMAVLALGGNMVTTWSWFGTNQLGVGLHAYGFNNSLATGCMATWLLHLGFIGVGVIPHRYWGSAPPQGAATKPDPAEPADPADPGQPTAAPRPAAVQPQPPRKGKGKRR